MAQRNWDEEVGPAGTPHKSGTEQLGPLGFVTTSPTSPWQTPAHVALHGAPRLEHSQLATTVLTHVSQRQDFRLFVGVDYPRISSALAFNWEVGWLFLRWGEHTPVSFRRVGGMWVGGGFGSQHSSAPITGAVWLWPSLAFSLLLCRTHGLNDPPGLPAPRAHD